MHQKGEGVQGGGKGRGGKEKKGRRERNSAVGTGLSHRSRTAREVGWEGQSNRWPTEWSGHLHEGQEGSSALPILAW